MAGRGREEGGERRPPRESRRRFIRRTALGVLGFGAVLGTLHQVRSGSPSLIAPEMRLRGLLRPPGAVPEEELQARCIRCEKCSEACETDAIRLFGPGSGSLEGTPHIVAEERACNLCLECGKACPTGALEPLEERTEARMGVARVDEHLCVSHNGTGICGACFTVCPLRGKAITQGLFNRPTVIPEKCVGCGLCEEACIVHRAKAIRVHTERRWTRRA